MELPPDAAFDVCSSTSSASSADVLITRLETPQGSPKQLRWGDQEERVDIDIIEGDGARDWAAKEAESLGATLAQLDALRAALDHTVQRMVEASQGKWVEAALSAEVARRDELQQLRLSTCGHRASSAEVAGLSSPAHAGSDHTSGKGSAAGEHEHHELAVVMAPAVHSSSRTTFVSEGATSTPAVPPLPWPASVQIRQGLAGLDDPNRVISNRVISERVAAVNRPQVRTRSLSKRLHAAKNSAAWTSFTSALLKQMRDRRSGLNKARTWLITLFLLYEVIVTPLVWGFDLPLEGWLVVQLFISAAFWTFDMGWSFIQGYDVDGKRVTDPFLSMKHYLKNGFPLDMLCVSLDVASGLLLVLFSEESDFKTVTRYLRLVRLLGLLRLRRLLKMLLFKVLLADVESPSSLMLMVGAILSMMVISNHIQACVWAFIGRNGPSDTGAHWMDMHVQVGQDMHPFRDMRFMYRYFAIFHWHMGQTTVGQSIHTANTLEMIFNVLGLFVALLTACTVVSMLSATLTNYQLMVQSRTQQLRTLRQYLLENPISSRTFVLAVRQARERIRKSSRLTEKNVQALSLLSTALRSTIHYEVFLPFLQENHFLRLWTRLDTTSAQELCQVATDFDVLLPHDEVFQAGADARRVFFMATGRCEYKQHPRSSSVTLERAVEVVGRKWLVEAAIWCEWFHVGDCTTLVPCEVFTLDALQWAELLPRRHVIADIALEYAAQFCKRLASCTPPHAPWPDDLQVPFTGSSQIVAAMSSQAKEVIGLDALSDATTAHRLSEHQLEKLQKQVTCGQCVLFLDESGSLKRVTSGVSMEIQRPSDGKFLVQLGKIKEGAVSAAVMLPRHKSEIAELPHESAQRLARKKLGPIAPHLTLEAPIEEKEIKMSAVHGIHTEHVQLKFPAFMASDCDIPPMFIYGQAQNTADGLVSRVSSVKTREGIPECFLFPGESPNTNYCFAWLTAEELAGLHGKQSEVTSWLERAHWQSEVRRASTEQDAPRLGLGAREDGYPCVIDV